ncbi:TPA: hypothetical protein HIF43_004882 [Escherichia coli]|nr:hypothetical protein [Escherichia coli]
MISKDVLMNKFKQSSSDRKDRETRELNDIKEFQESVRTLFTKLGSWLKDIPVTIEISRKNIHDITTQKINSYSMDFMKISNGNKHLEFRPEALYLMGAKGEVEVRFSGIHRNLKFNLYMQDSFGDGKSEPGIWSLVDGNNRAGNRSPFSKEQFYSLVSNLV